VSIKHRQFAGQEGGLAPASSLNVFQNSKKLSVESFIGILRISHLEAGASPPSQPANSQTLMLTFPTCSLAQQNITEVSGGKDEEVDTTFIAWLARG
jgi:hypothetical protein